MGKAEKAWQQQPQGVKNQALYLAAIRRDASAIQRALRYGADANYATPRTRETPLHRACSCVDKSTAAAVKILLKAGADASAQDSKGRTALHVAVCSGNVYNKQATHTRTAAVIELLLEADADVSAQDCEGRTVLHWACVRGYGFLCPHCGSNFCINAPSQPLSRMLHHAALRNADLLEVPDRHGRTALSHAVEHKYYGLVRLLLKHGANPHATDCAGRTALLQLCSCSGGEIVFVRLLLNADATLLRARDHRQRTALHCAVAGGNRSIIRELLARSDNDDPFLPLVKDADGMTALDCAVEQTTWRRESTLECSNAILEWYRNFVIRTAKQEKQPTTALHFILQSASYRYDTDESRCRVRLPVGGLSIQQFTQFLTDGDGPFVESVTTPSRHGDLPLHVACRTEGVPVQVLRLLAADNSNDGLIHRRNGDGRFPLQLLCDTHNPTLAAVQFLLKAHPPACAATPFSFASAAAAAASVDVIFDLLRAYPAALVKR